MQRRPRAFDLRTERGRRTDVNERRWPPAAWAAGGLLFVAPRHGQRRRLSIRRIRPGVSHSGRHPRPESGGLPARRRLDRRTGALHGRSTKASRRSSAQPGIPLRSALRRRVPAVARARLDGAAADRGARLPHAWATVALGAAFTLGTASRAPAPTPSSRTSIRACSRSPSGCSPSRRSFAGAPGWRSCWSLCAALVHVTTGLWFAVLIGVAIVVAASAAGARVRPSRHRRPHDRRLGSGDRPTLVVTRLRWTRSGWRPCSRRTRSFPSQWPAWAWVANLALPVVLWVVHQRRSVRGHATEKTERSSGVGSPSLPCS